MRLAAGLCPYTLGSYSAAATPDPLAVIRGRGERGRKRLGIGRDEKG